MQRRNFLIGAGSAAVGASALIGSGAFTSVEAERQVTVETAGDAQAYLALTGDEEYVSSESEGMLTIDLGGATTTNNGGGFNDDAITTVEAVDIENRGTNDVDVTVDDTELGAGVTATINNGPLTLPAGNTEERAIEFVVDTLNEDPDGTQDLGILTIEATDST